MHFIAKRILNILILLLLLSSYRIAQAEIIDKIVAQVGDKIITQYDIESYAPATVRDIYAMPEGATKKEAWDKYYSDTIENLIHANIVQIATAREGITTESQEIQEGIMRLQQENSMFRDEINRIIGINGIITPEVHLYVQTIILQQKLMPSLRYRSVITEEDIAKYLESDSQRVLDKNEYNIKVAFIPGKEAYDMFLQQVKGPNFESVGKSLGADILNMGWVMPNMLLSDMRDLVTNTEAGAISSPMIDEEGRYIVVYVIDKKSSSGISESEREYIINELKIKQMEVIFNNWLERNKGSILVQRYDQ